MEEEKVVIEEFSEENGYTRQEVLKKSLAAGAGLAALGMLSVEPALGARKGLDRVRWISPRGTLDVMDDYNLIVPIKMGYFRKLGLDVKLNAGPGRNEMQLLAANQVDVGYPSPGVLTFAIDSGVPVYSIWEQYPAQVFDFVVPANSTITSPSQLAGKTISVLTIGWKPIVDPILDEAGVDPASVKYVEFGPQWVQAVVQGQADAGLAWEGLRAQLLGQAATFGSAFQIKFLIGAEFSKDPSNVYAIRKSELTNSAKRDIYTRFLAGVVQGFEFGKANPRAAAQLTYNQYPALQQIISPQVALRSMMELASGYGLRKRQGFDWGSHDVNAWARFLNRIYRIGQVKKEYAVGDVLTNGLVKAANRKADVAGARRDAKAFKLDQYFKGTTIPKGLPL